MKKYFVLYMAPVAEMDKMMSSMSPEEQKKGMKEWTDWQAANKESIVEFGTPLGKNKRVTAKGVSDVRNEIGGYSIVQANSHEEAAELMRSNPHLKIPGGYIEVLAVVDMPGI